MNHEQLCLIDVGLPKPRLYALVREEILPAVRFGKSIRFSVAALERFVNEGGRRSS